MVVGDGSFREFIEQAAEESGAGDRITFAGAVTDDELVALYRDALCLVYAPYDEDYGLATLEAFLGTEAGDHCPRLGWHAGVRATTATTGSSSNRIRPPSPTPSRSSTPTGRSPHRSGATDAISPRTITWDDGRSTDS